MSNPELMLVPLVSVQPHPLNVRIDLGPLWGLAESIKTSGLFNPIVLIPNSHGKSHGECIECGKAIPRKQGNIEAHGENGSICSGSWMPAADEWYILAGHRRVAAARLAGIEELPARARHDLRDNTDIVYAIMEENEERQNLSPVEQATGFKQLRLFDETVARIATRTRCSQQTVSRRLRLLELPTEAQQKLHFGEITLHDAEALLDLPPESAERALKEIGTRKFRETVMREKGIEDPDDIVTALRAEFFAQFIAGAQRPPQAQAETVRREALATVWAGLPKAVRRAWAQALGKEDVKSVDADRALIALAAVMEAPQDGLLRALGYEFSELEEGA